MPAGAVVSFCARCPVLTNLNCASCIQLGDADVARIFEASPKLKEVNFSRCKQISDAALAKVLAVSVNIR